MKLCVFVGREENKVSLYVFVVGKKKQMNVGTKKQKVLWKKMLVHKRRQSAEEFNK